VQNAFLHSVLEEEVLMKQPPGYEDKHVLDLVCKLDKAIYVFKQAPRTWYSKLNSKLQMLGFIPSKGDTLLFFYSTKAITMFVLVYIYDIIIACSSPVAAIRDVERDFALKDLDTLNYFLVIEVSKINDGILLPSQICH
jgi:hypothetical protein